MDRKLIAIEEKGRYLSTWKEIAQYLGRGVRTVQRWEERLGMPVRRLDEKRRSAVMAIAEELDSWVTQTTIGLLHSNGSQVCQHQESPYSLSILVVESSPSTRNACAAGLLKRLGLPDVHVASDVAPAISMIADMRQDGTSKLDLIILDLGSFGQKAIDILRYANACSSSQLEDRRVANGHNSAKLRSLAK